MENMQSVPDLIETALATSATFESSIAGAQSQSGAHTEEQLAGYVGLELLAIDTFSLFEARMQHHFKRGPFSKKLRALLVDAGQADLADRVYQYYLAINVLKHGNGASYRELRDAPNALFAVKPTENARSGEDAAPSGLVDVGVPGFFAGLAKTLLEAHQFLEKR